MKKVALALRLLLACAALLVVAAPVFAGTSSWSGRVESSDPTWFHPGNGCGAAVVGAEWFDTQLFSVDASGSYTITMTASTGAISPDGFFALYDTRFDPASPQAACMTTDDDSGPGAAPALTVTLLAGHTYVLVTTQCCDGLAAGQEMNYTNTMTGPGNIALFSSLATDIDGNGVVDALTDGLLLLRWQFGLRGASLIAGAVDPNATRNTAPLIEAYLAGLGVHSGPSLLFLTALVGGTNGGAYVRSCDPTSVAVGLIVNQGTIEPPDVGSVTIVCAPVVSGALGAAALGAPTTNLAAIGIGAGATATLSCASGSVITGLQGSTKLVFGGFATVVENLSLQCSPLIPGPMAVVGPAGAGNTTPFTLLCPAGTAMRGLQGNAEQLVDGLQVRCR